MKYEENVWYGWNGGKCPVHPETVVEAVMDNGHIETDTAMEWDWSVDPSPYANVIAFRVIKEHTISRENQGPVREVTTVRKVIVPGVYGAVEVWEDCSDGGMAVDVKPIRLDRAGMDELTAAIQTLTAIRDAMADLSGDAATTQSR